MDNLSHKLRLVLLLLVFISQTVVGQTGSTNTLYQDLQIIKKQLVPDKRVAILDIELKDTLQPVIIVSGETDLPDAKKQIIQFLTDRKISFVDSIRVVPDSLVGEKTWGLVILSVANMRSQPDDASELVSQAMMGTPIKLLDYKNKWYRVQTPENYIGWMDASSIQRLAPSEMNSWKQSGRYLYNQISGYAYDAPGKKGGVVSDLVLGDLFVVESAAKGFLKMKFPDGRTGYVRKSECISFEEWCSLKPNAQSVLSVARQMMGFPYLWGGASGKALDCSGFVKLAYYSQGVILARDASQQARYGEKIDFSNMNNLQPGDLLFFGRSAQRISHVGLYLGNGDFIHSSGRVHISSLDPADPKYVPTRINVAANRVLNSLNAEGIIMVKNHPWYSHEN